MPSRDQEAVHAFGRRLAQCRQARGFSQAELAEQLGLDSAETISRYERGEREPRLSSILRLAEVLGVGMTALMPVDSSSSEDDELSLLAREAEELISRLGPERLDSARHCVFAVRGIVAGGDRDS